jgi:hypothetical protein
VAKTERTDPFDPRIAFETADAFYRAAAFIAEHWRDAPLFGATYLAATSFTNLSLATEHFLKCLKMRTSGKPPYKSHDLRYLFDDLDVTEKKAIENNHKILISSSRQISEVLKVQPHLNFNLYYVLDASRDTFIEWRYFYEKLPNRSYGLIYVAFAIRTRLVELERDWGFDFPLPQPDDTPYIFLTGP